MISAWVPCLAFALLDWRTGRRGQLPAAAQAPPPRAFAHMAAVAVRNELAGAAVAAAWFAWFGRVVPAEATLLEALAWFPAYAAAYFVGYDVVFFVGHRLLHVYPVLYRFGHKLHHATFANRSAGSK